jgi:indolepyruvate ferredoxin oxidoreductase alpha subunit
MGAGIGVGLGLRHTLPPDEARRVVSVIGDSTFVHSGITGLVEMVYNPPPTGHLVIILDNGATAMTGLQDHPATGRRLDGQPSHQLKMEDIARAVGVPHVQVVETRRENGDLDDPIRDALARDECTVIIARRPCLLAARKSTERACPQESPTPPCPAT